MKANVAVYTFAICVFVAFLLWSAKNLGIIGLLGAFSVGLISYSMDSSIETAVASVVIAGVIIKFILPSIQAKWIEKYANYDAPIIEQQIHSAERTHERIQKMQNGEKAIEGFHGLSPQLLEGFATAPVANLSQPPTDATPANATGTGVGNQQQLSPTVGTTNIQGQGVLQTSDTAGANTSTSILSKGMDGTTSTQQVGQTGLTAPIPQVSFQAQQGSTMQQIGGVAVQQPLSGSIPTITYSQTPPPPTQSVQPAGAANVGTASASAPFSGATQLPAISTPTPSASGSLAAPANLTTSSTLQTATTGIGATAGMGATAGTGATAGMGATAGTGAAAGGQAVGFRNIETFEEQPQQVPGMFKLGELPSESKGGPHIDAGTTIMRALGALNPDQISSLTEDTRKLLDTQKSLMGMLSTMKPMLSDGQNLLASFTNMFGKTN